VFLELFGKKIINPQRKKRKAKITFKKGRGRRRKEQWLWSGRDKESGSLHIFRICITKK